MLSHECRQPAFGRHPSHQHGVVNHAAGIVDDVLDAEVDVRAEAPVQRDLRATHLPAQSRVCSGR